MLQHHPGVADLHFAASVDVPEDEWYLILRPDEWDPYETSDTHRQYQPET
ncbi:MAG: hypothetical protein FWE80_02955 [Oscillospiraceae bacterium]|nr:hypothetical protein [Oscillospiraceae bacterium]